MNKKEQYGEVKTPNVCIDMMIDMLPVEVFTDKTTWLDPCAGDGRFMDRIKMNYIINNNNITQVEINNEYEHILKTKKGKTIITNFLKLKLNKKFDVIIGNPPYNRNGMKKVPTNNKRSKLNDGETIWPAFIRKSIEFLNEDGYLCMIVPSIWLKLDKAGIYNLILSNKVLKIRSFSSTQTKQMFSGDAQTPTTIFVLQNHKQLRRVFMIPIYDALKNKYINFKMRKGTPIPTHTPSIVNKIMNKTRQYGSLSVNIIKTNNPPKRDKYINFYPIVYKGVYTYTLKDGFTVTTRSTPYPYQNEPKIIMAHKMYGIPYYDKRGEYGISNRDNYILLQGDKTALEMNRYMALLSSSCVLFLFDTTRYRMRFLEKYAFEYIPDILKVGCGTTDTELYEFFGLTKKEIVFMNSNYNNICTSVYKR
jgi:hypothetical protein